MACRHVVAMQKQPEATTCMVHVVASTAVCFALYDRVRLACQHQGSVSHARVCLIPVHMLHIHTNTLFCTASRKQYRTK